MKHTDPHHYIEKWSDLTPNDDKEVEKENVKKVKLYHKNTQEKKGMYKITIHFPKKAVVALVSIIINRKKL